ncbi:putative endonuclease [Pustulibacterium marinum]|uniref:UPF0102 protein SAMN05216480_11353 n=1 Tax=Pustulibacterium marinum TaxID=1224947 RepID=A0A1I7I6V5_9FLAO|nr:YraN family protein [Pustulibacterium marinum]SFU68630.1 putative endonuclease [Pustulibacterium marinum]
MAEHNQFGKEAEERAAQYLLGKKYSILERNYYYQKAEIDILALKENTLVVVEVKARSSSYFGEPEQFVSKKKIRLLTNAVDIYVNKNDLDVEVRFDIISILRQNNELIVNHIEDAFYFF